MPREHSGPTMADVAREAGVALGTVSRVVNGEQVGDAFREKVQAAITKLGYKYNSSGRALRTDETNTVAVIMPNCDNPFFGLLVNYICIALRKRKRRMLLCLTENDRDRETELIQMAQQNRVDGIIALTYNPKLTIPENIPLVTIDRFFSLSVPCIASDNFGGGVLAARKLQMLGCTRVAFLQTASELPTEPKKRRDGFVSACVEIGLPFEVKVITTEEKEPASEFDLFLQDHMENGHLAFDGLFVGTDSLAWQIIKKLRGMGVRVPEDVQVIGFDGIRLFGCQEYVVSTIVQPVPEIAEACVNTVLSRHFSNVPSLIILPVTYARGGTTRE
ncbi:MAG: LacI family DNA-binding transcriptional regulator [Clostridia bacterium]|nr:LacI family DNA-binding transcriptional regulator [Clostridia bacterium]